jgi:hypothetical protein
LDLLIDSFTNKQSISVSGINAREPIWPHDIWRHLRRFPRLRLGVNPNGNGLKGEGQFLAGSNCAAFEEGITSRGIVEAYYVLRTKSRVGFDEFIATCQSAGFDFDRISLCVEEFSYAAKH